ncbi:hypothetical protein COCC4DRAFT_208126 [Bipolaris maydis ATCC 48331]|uniref:NAD(P)-binding protein n=2 Tax=Cochliobolus heterostrophus TaxID=5016 RepID=M2TTX1_COCH5|nr:uncharacterized protein COCC4DRAFT_208126 [Bipolaris maydis ATCC 48331]EMD85216.1 hypothetical protein COCHEDRAFT_1188701 [Bipolaris maydis C5]KAH7564350.1 hypothetical protein BM1_01397 [Bipolaris maydis]ENH99329.1 hypothetical protein COCC4DRAFT_208126 [Bipolaris maydis ATCC 48331]KAJ5026973.1 hypothetical protein J3E73DRAFT_431842 [Bipolaris maydis]KAJ5059275.1 hypothetical protein J3E74DRAFT_271906 [Bipolaris maydis]
MICHREPYPALEAVQRSAAGKYVLITNASHGIGRAIAISWAGANAAGIAMSSLNTEDLEPVTSEIRCINPNIPIVAMTCDTASSFDINDFFSATKESFGKLDVAIANVGTAHLENLDAINDNDLWWADVMTNFRSTHLTAHQYLRTFGPSPTGTFISITSGANFYVGPGVSSHEFAQQIDCRLLDFLTFEYPMMKAFSLDSGPIQVRWTRLAHGHFEIGDPELAGLFSVWLGGGRADLLRGNSLRAEWDINELELNMRQALERDTLKQKMSSGCLRLATRQV